MAHKRGKLLLLAELRTQLLEVGDGHTAEVTMSAVSVYSLQ